MDRSNSQGLYLFVNFYWSVVALGFACSAVVKNPPANAEDMRVMGSIPSLGISPGGGHRTYASILAWRIPWTEEPGGLQSMGSQIVRHD